MLAQVREFVLFIHILLGIAWLGGILFVGWGVYPAAKKLPFSNQRDFLFTIMKHTHILFTLAGLGVLITGVILGSILGPINSWNSLTNTHYGKLFSLAGIIAFASLSWGALISYNFTMKMLKNNQLWEYAERGGTEPLKSMMRRVTFISSIEVIGLFIVVWMMVLL